MHGSSSIGWRAVSSSSLRQSEEHPSIPLRPRDRQGDSREAPVPLPVPLVAVLKDCHADALTLEVTLKHRAGLRIPGAMGTLQLARDPTSVLVPGEVEVRDQPLKLRLGSAGESAIGVLLQLVSGAFPEVLAASDSGRLAPDFFKPLDELLPAHLPELLDLFFDVLHW